MKKQLTRRDFLKLTGLGLGALAFAPSSLIFPQNEFPNNPRLGRIFSKTEVKARPSFNSPTVDTFFDDKIVPWLRESVADQIDLNQFNQRWVETPQGYVFGHYIQPVRNEPNIPLLEIPAGQEGFWAEVTVPYVDFVLDNPPPRSFFLLNLLSEGLPTRLYYSQVMWIDQIKRLEDGRVLYRILERYGNPGDIFWADGAAFRPIAASDIAPISPDVDPMEKKIVANLTYQHLTCYEGGREVYFCRMSSGVLGLETPLGTMQTWRKLISVRMAGGVGASGYDTPGVSWTTLIQGDGIAIHATFWHNNYGQVRSHGCLNVKPEDARWIFCWTTPTVEIASGDYTVKWPEHSTIVEVEERLY